LGQYKPFINNSTQNAVWNTNMAELDFITGSSSTHTLGITGADVGQNLAGYTNNLAWGILDLTGQILNLVDGNAASGGALYVGRILGLNLNGMTVTNILNDLTNNDINIYYDSLQNTGLHGLTYNLENGGQLLPSSPVPLPGAVLLLGAGLTRLAAYARRKKAVA
jgi:hypothetical protein